MSLKHLLNLSLAVVLLTTLAPAARTGSQFAPSLTASTQPSSVPVTHLDEDTPGTPTPLTSASQKEWDDLPPEVRAKVDPRILAELRGETIPAHLGGGREQSETVSKSPVPLDKTRFLVHLKVKADLEPISKRRFTTQVERRTAVFDALVDTARVTQGPVKALLDTRMRQGDVASYQPFYIFNGLAVEGDLDTIIELALRDDVERIVANYALVPLWQGDGAPDLPSPVIADLEADNWNIDLVDADRAWEELGVTGQGAVVGSFDTGVDWTHPALQSRYRGYGLAGTDHNYNWFEADPGLYPGGNLGPSVSSAPYDCDGHGTHTTGTMVGDGGRSGTQVGMAPGAKWIAAPGICGNTMPEGLADDIGGIKTFQWFLCPTDLTGQLSSADCSQAPDVVNNSWGSSNPADDTFYAIIQALRTAGIAPVFSSGNPSAGSGSIGSPASAPEAITVGATDIDDKIASFSGRGPSFYEGEQKPELSAPGVNINSTIPDGEYSGPTYSGTSMAAPHVAGLIALMASADIQDGYRDFSVDELERFMESTAVDLGPIGPDDDYGYGRIDAYRAVRWVLAAGDLRGTVTDESTSAPVRRARVSGIERGSSDPFSTETGAGGQYSTTVPAGTYDVVVEAWGYYGDTFPDQMVITGALSLADFGLRAMPTATLTGHVYSSATPVDGALVYVADAPWVADTTGGDGAYTLNLPVGAHEMVVKAVGYRVLHEAVSIGGEGSSHDLSVTPAPTIFLVEADASLGWYGARPVHNFFAWALEEEAYLYDLWAIQYTTFNDTQVQADGSTGYGIPSTTTLSTYDVVIWTHTGFSPGGIGADDELMSYLDGGGRLILSGQDIGYWDDGTAFYDSYLHADHTMDIAANEGNTVSGSGFLAGLNLKVTSGALHNYPNTSQDLRPDAVAPEDGAAYPAMSYDNGNGAAVLAVAPCDAPYRAVYLALGYENIGPRGYSRDPDIAKVMDLSLDWVMDAKSDFDVNLSVVPQRQMGLPGSTVAYGVHVLNTGAQIDTFTIGLSGNTWATRIYSGAVELTAPVEIAPCGALHLTMEVDIPPAANTNDADTVTVTATGNASDVANATTTAFPEWQLEPAMPTPRYRLAACNLPGDLYTYAIGGLGGPSWNAPMNANERYNACSKQWEAMAPMPTPRGNVSAAAIDGKIHVPGGYASERFYDVLEIYDPATDSWSSGAPMPAALSGMAVAAYGGKLYTFGGDDDTGLSVDATYEYDPTTDTWTPKSPMPGGSRSYAAAAERNGKIYVVGGWFVNTVEVYDPATDAWSTAAAMNVPRQSPGVTGAPDGYLYVSGGGDSHWNGLSSTERYDPLSDTWQILPSLNDGNRAGSASAYAAGRVFAIGGVDLDLSDVNESLKLFNNFCTSTKVAWQSIVHPGERITYTAEISPHATDLTGASVVDPIPPGTTFAGFGVNAIGAHYNTVQDRVEWSGTIPDGGDPLTFTFGVDVDLTGWRAGDLIANVATFGSGTGLVFSRTAVTAMDLADPSPSAKSVDKLLALEGETLTYTIHIQNASLISDVFTVADPIPAHATYVPGSLTYTLGTAGYDTVNDVITWTGTVPGIIYVPGGYDWGDSDGGGTVPEVQYSWVEITGTNHIAFGDDTRHGPFPIGFPISFYGIDYTDFWAGSNGWLVLGTEDPGMNDPSSDCPLPSSGFGIENFVAGIWDDLVPNRGTPNGSGWYQSYLAGSCPYLGYAGACLVVEWAGMYHFASSPPDDLTFEIMLFDNNDILIQIQDAGDEAGSGSTTGLENADASAGLTYACHSAGSIHDDLAVRLQSALIPVEGPSDITFAVAAGAPLPGNTWITNTATITGSTSSVERSAGTLINPVNLSTSTKDVDKTEAAREEVVTFDFVLANTGLLTATGASLIDPIPVETAYVPGSVSCGGGTCDYASGDVTWTGDIAPGGSVTLTFAVTLTALLPDLTPVTNTATLDDGAGDLYDLNAVFYARLPDLGASFKQVSPSLVKPGDILTYTIYVHNTGAGAAVGEMEDELPLALTYDAGSLVCGSGSCGYASGVITWSGTLYPRSIAPVRFRALVSTEAADGDVITNTAVVIDALRNTSHEISAAVEVVKQKFRIFLPILKQNGTLP